eukprot:1724640-Amphidinium_carterae.1
MITLQFAFFQMNFLKNYCFGLKLVQTAALDEEEEIGARRPQQCRPKTDDAMSVSPDARIAVREPAQNVYLCKIPIPRLSPIKFLPNYYLTHNHYSQFLLGVVLCLRESAWCGSGGAVH